MPAVERTFLSAILSLFHSAIRWIREAGSSLLRDLEITNDKKATNLSSAFQKRVSCCEGVVEWQGMGKEKGRAWGGVLGTR
jgi:hypothetical protein